MSDIRDFCPLWGEWEVESKLGEGSYGAVWKVKRNVVGGKVYYAAVKHISIPKDESEIDRLIDEGIFTDQESAKRYYDNTLKSLVDEIDAMHALRGYTNIVFSAEQSRTYLSGGRANEALEAALAAFPAMPDGTVLTTPEGILALSNAGRFCETGTVVPCGVLESEEKIISLGLSPDGRTVSVNGNRYDAVTLEPLPAETQDWEIPG